MMRNRRAGLSTNAVLLLSLLGLAGCAAADQKTCYGPVEHEYGQVLMRVPCPPADKAEPGG